MLRDNIIDTLVAKLSQTVSPQDYTSNLITSKG